MASTSALEIKTALRADGVPVETVKNFLEYHLKRPEIWRYFETFTLQAIANKKRIGAKAVMERVRWETVINNHDTFKCSNSYTAYYARIFHLKHSDYDGYFVTKQVRGLRDAA